MFIYILGKSTCYNDGYMEDIVELVSADIQNILDYLSLDRISYLTMMDYSILIKLDGEKDFCEELFVNKSMCEKLTDHPSSKLLEYELEYNDMKNKIIKWCKNTSERLEEERKKEEESKRLKTEYAERALYEKLKRKYEKQNNSFIGKIGGEI